MLRWPIWKRPVRLVVLSLAALMATAGCGTIEQRVGVTVERNGGARLETVLLVDAAIWDSGAAPMDLPAIEAEAREQFDSRAGPCRSSPSRKASDAACAPW